MANAWTDLNAAVGRRMDLHLWLALLTGGAANLAYFVYWFARRWTARTA